MTNKKVDLTPLASKIPHLYESSSRPSEKIPPQPAERRSKLVAFVVAGVLGLAVIAGGLVWHFHSPPRRVQAAPQASDEQPTASAQSPDPELSPEEIKQIESLMKAAAAGNAEAMAQLGQIYLDEQDYAEARHWYEQAAAAGDSRGMYGLGILYRNGQGVPLDESKALEWEEKAAAARNRESKGR